VIIKQLTVGSMEVFCYLLGCEETGEAVVIDAGGDEEEILTLLGKLGLALVSIINTHCHPDHTAGNRRLKEATGAEIVMHEADAALLADRQAGSYFAGLGFPPAPPADRLVRDGDLLPFGRHALRVIHTPGHSPGSICLLAEGNLFTGDALFVGAAGRVDIPGGDFRTQMSALAEKISVLPPETIIWPGHDYGDTAVSSIEREKKENPFLGGEW